MSWLCDFQCLSLCHPSSAVCPCSLAHSSAHSYVAAAGQGWESCYSPKNSWVQAHSSSSSFGILLTPHAPWEQLSWDSTSHTGVPPKYSLCITAQQFTARRGFHVFIRNYKLLQKKYKVWFLNCSWLSWRVGKNCIAVSGVVKEAQRNRNCQETQ